MLLLVIITWDLNKEDVGIVWKVLMFPCSY